jgi:hypothetical protein
VFDANRAVVAPSIAGAAVSQHDRRTLAAQRNGGHIAVPRLVSDIVNEVTFAAGQGLDRRQFEPAADPPVARVSGGPDRVSGRSPGGQMLGRVGQ